MTHRLRFEIVAAVLSLAVLGGFAPTTGLGGARALAQGVAKPPSEQPQIRTIAGYVIDESEKPVVGVTVFLKDLKTKSLRSYTTVERGRFRFAQATMVNDLEIWAEKDGKRSATKTISSWDTRREFELELRLK